MLYFLHDLVEGRIPLASLKTWLTYPPALVLLGVTDVVLGAAAHLGEHRAIPVWDWEKHFQFEND